MSEESTGPAPDLRVLQANERTFLAWVRTGLALNGFGFVVARLPTWLAQVEPGTPPRSPGASLAVGIGFVALGTAIHLLAARRFVLTRRAIIAGRPAVPGSAAGLALAGGLAALGLALIAYLVTR